MPVNPQDEFDLTFEGREVPAEEKPQPTSGVGEPELPPEFLKAVQELQQQYGNIPIEAEIIPAQETPPTEATETTATESGVPPTEIPPEGQPPVEDWEQKYKSFKGSADAQLRQAMEREKAYQEEISRLRSLVQQQTQAPTQEAEEKEVGSEQTLSVEEDPEIKEFIETYPEIAKPVNKLLRASLDKAVQNVLSEIDKRGKSLQEVIDPLKDEIGYLQKAHHLDQILRVHPDAMEIATSGALEQWILTQPPEVQSQLNVIVDMGTPDQVISVLDSFKKAQQEANQKQSSEPQPAPQSQEFPAQGPSTEVPLQEPKAPQLSPENAQKLSMIEAVKRKGATQPKISKAVDFDTAFEEAVRGLTNV